MKMYSIDESNVYQNVDAVLVIRIERRHDEGCVVKVARTKQNWNSAPEENIIWPSLPNGC